MLHRVAEPVEFFHGRVHVGRNARAFELSMLDGSDYDAVLVPHVFTNSRSINTVDIDITDTA